MNLFFESSIVRVNNCTAIMNLNLSTQTHTHTQDKSSLVEAYIYGTGLCTVVGCQAVKLFARETFSYFICTKGTQTGDRGGSRGYSA